MVQRYKKQHRIFYHEPGDVVLLKIPPKLLSLSPTPLITCIVKSPAFNNTYTLYCIHGLLDRRQPAASLKSVSPLLWPSCKFGLVDTKILLRSALQLMSSSPSTALKPCSCKGSCGKRCGCVKARRSCLPNCHGGEQVDCHNIDAEGETDCAGTTTASAQPMGDAEENVLR
jgi:hypothetical protein